jgi:hypothetical protein
MTAQPVQAMQTVQTVPLHPVLGAVAAAQDAMKAVRDVQPVFMIAAEKETAVTELAGSKQWPQSSSSADRLGW